MDSIDLRLLLVQQGAKHHPRMAVTQTHREIHRSLVAGTRPIPKHTLGHIRRNLFTRRNHHVFDHRLLGKKANPHLLGRRRSFRLNLCLGTIGRENTGPMIHTPCHDIGIAPRPEQSPARIRYVLVMVRLQRSGQPHKRILSLLDVFHDGLDINR